MTGRGRLWFCLLLCTATPAFPAGPDFTRDVRPVLARRCFKCHGPDDKTREAGLRLDDRAEAIAAKAIVPGRPDDSEFVKRIVSTDEGEVMPPPHVKAPLTAAEKALLRDWIAAGAEYKAHWSFTAPVRPPVPQIAGAAHPIDAFVAARLKSAGLTANPEADRRTLIRRVSLDLTGLPPTPQEAAAFVADPDPAAYEKLVDRLLASPRYGERWARRWLDLARYADTNGYEKDRPRSIWPYRDWVIAALNADMPFDRFTVEQLAGDLLPGATPDQRVATGFHRNTMLNEEGGIDPLEFRYHAMADRVAVTGTVWLGLTVGCAQCHTHKYDPLPHRDYYRLMAFLDNADEPEIAVERPADRARREEIERKIAEAEAALAGRFPPEPAKDKDDPRTEDERRRDHLRRRFAEWAAAESAKAVRWTVLRPAELKSTLPILTAQDDGSVLAEGDQGKSDAYELRFAGELKGVTAIRLEALPDERLPRGGPGRVYYEGPIGDFFLSEFSVEAGGKKVALREATHSFSAGKKFPASAAIDGDPQSGWSVNGGQGRAHWAVFRFAEPLDAAAGLSVRMLFERYYAAGLGRFRISVTGDARPAAARDLPADIEDLLAVSAAKRTEAQWNRLLRHFLLTAPDLAKARSEIDKLRARLPRLPTTLVMAERPKDHRRRTFVRNRGEFLQPTEEVAPGVPGFLPPLPAGAAPDRLAFARWLVSAENPLTARVAVNREWAAFFGTGLVRTVGDFGLTGEPPSHPELLDWLATEFVAGGWSLKKLHRLIVTSAAYRRGPRVAADAPAKDPDNRLLARGPRQRLDAEMLRDAALHAAGLLSAKMGGPSVFPPQPPGVTTEGTYGKLEWKPSTGEDRYRRSLYTFAKRTAPFALYATFDAPSGEFCTPRRDVTNTPLQALSLLNDPVFLEAAQALGRRAAERPGTDAERAAELFEQVLTRPPTPDETALLTAFVQAQAKRFAAGDPKPGPLAGPGPGDPAARAAWTALARVLLNCDEFVTR